MSIAATGSLHFVGEQHPNGVGGAGPVLAPRLHTCDERVVQRCTPARSDEQEGFGGRSCCNAHRRPSIARSVWISSFAIELICELAW